MRITHTTMLANLDSIMELGLLCSYARQGRKAVWVHTRKDDAWAEAHVMCRHHAEGDTIIHIDLDVPKSWLKRHNRAIFYCMRDIPSSRIKRVRVVTRVVKTLKVKGR